MERPQYARVRGRQVDVASPNPRPLPLDETDHRSRLGIVDDHRIEVVPESGRIRFVHPPVFGFQLRRQSDRRTLERVVDRLRRVVEPRGPGEDEPGHVEAEIAHQGDDAVEQFGDAAAVGGGVHLRDPLPPEFCTEGEDLSVGRIADDGPVVRDVLLRDRDFFHSTNPALRKEPPLISCSVGTRFATVK